MPSPISLVVAHVRGIYNVLLAKLGSEQTEESTSEGPSANVPACTRSRPRTAPLFTD